MTPTQQKAIRELHRNGNEGAIDRYGALVAGGVRLTYLADTWLRLITTGHVESRGPNRIGLTALGVECAGPAPLKVNPHACSVLHAAKPAHPGAE